ncbi:PilW family protein [Microbacterium sp.]|uniref:PilW family protein n=1 Tax=Microbacterium sp. TaxID=51671 RepID=UPI00351D30FA
MWRRRDDDRGMTLVELMVYIFLGVIVSTIVGGILINALRVQVQVLDASTSADAGTTVSDSIGRGVRNSSDLAQSTPAPGGILVRSRSLDSTPATSTGLDDRWVCLAWYAVDDRIYSRASTASIPDPTSTAPAGWTLIASDVEPVDSATPIFAVVDDGGALQMAFTARTGDGGPQLISTEITSLQALNAASPERVSSPCF